MQLTLTSLLSICALTQTAAAHGFKACWLQAGTNNNMQSCWDVDVPNAVVGVCMTIDNVRKQVEAIGGSKTAGGADVRAIKVYTPYTCYFFTNGNCAGNVQGNRWGTDYVQVLGGRPYTNIYPDVAFKTFRCDK